jgi:hypothetical protein
MRREVMWVPWTGPGLEHLRLTEGEGVVAVDGLIVGLDEGRSYRVQYALSCDKAWRVREVRVAVSDPVPHLLNLMTDGSGKWTTAEGESLPQFAGCLDVDLSATPFTNTLPIRRLGLGAGVSTELTLVYVKLPSLSLSVARQRYTRLETSDGAEWYRFESLPSGFTADLQVDHDGLVLDYPGLFHRVWSSGD